MCNTPRRHPSRRPRSTVDPIIGHSYHRHRHQRRQTVYPACSSSISRQRVHPPRSLRLHIATCYVAATVSPFDIHQLHEPRPTTAFSTTANTDILSAPHPRPHPRRSTNAYQRRQYWASRTYRFPLRDRQLLHHPLTRRDSRSHGLTAA